MRHEGKLLPLVFLPNQAPLGHMKEALGSIYAELLLSLNKWQSLYKSILKQDNFLKTVLDKEHLPSYWIRSF